MSFVFLPWSSTDFGERNALERAGGCGSIQPVDFFASRMMLQHRMAITPK
jgi:hypothetical protein